MYHNIQNDVHALPPTLSASAGGVVATPFGSTGSTVGERAGGRLETLVAEYKAASPAITTTTTRIYIFIAIIIFTCAVPLSTNVIVMYMYVFLCVG